MRAEIGDMILVGEHGDGSPRYGKVLAVINDNGDSPPWLTPAPSRLNIEPEPYRSVEVAPGVWTMDTL